MELSLNVRSVGDRSVLDVVGEVDVYSAPELRERLSELLSAAEPNLIVNLAEVTFLDSTGIGTLVAGLNRAVQFGGSLDARLRSRPDSEAVPDHRPRLRLRDPADGRGRHRVITRFDVAHNIGGDPSAPSRRSGYTPPGSQVYLLARQPEHGLTAPNSSFSRECAH